MRTMQKARFETFNSGILDIVQLKENKIVSDIERGVRFQEKTVGINRYWQANVVSVKIDRLVSVQAGLPVMTDHMVLIGKDQYKIKQVQYKQDTKPPTMLLSLERQVMVRKDLRNGEQDGN